MKTLFLYLVSFFALTSLSAQQDLTRRGWETKIPQGCFCCDSTTYNLPSPPPINGPRQVCSCEKVSYSTESCKGTQTSWTVVDNTGAAVIFSGQGSTTITIGAPIPANANSLTISVKITCGKKTTTNTRTVSIQPLPVVSSGFTYHLASNGFYTMSAAGVPGYGNAWRLVEVSGPDDCMNWKTGNTLAQVSSQDFNWTGTSATNNLIPGRHYRLIHWVEKCSKTWEASCYLTQVQCFIFTPASGMKPNKKVEFRDIKSTLIKIATPEINNDIENIKRN